MVLVHGDTTTSFAAALACFYLQIPVGHVGGGPAHPRHLQPWPEEFNRQAVDIVSEYYFAPTEASKQNLLDEGKRAEKIWVTGNTGIDALRTTVREDYTHPELEWASDSRLILITAHRRENLGEPNALYVPRDPARDGGASRHQGDLPYSHEPTRDARRPTRSWMASIVCISSTRLEVLDFHNFLAASHLILTDSGGIQEEAPSLGKPVLVMRDTTERPEGVAAGTLKLVGTEEDVNLSASLAACFPTRSSMRPCPMRRTLTATGTPASASRDALRGRMGV